MSQSILVTGGTGSFGSTFLKHLCESTTAETWRRIICFSRDELKQWELQQRLKDDRLRFFIGDVRDRDRLSLSMRGVDVVVHTAALKQVPAMEYNPTEAVQTNVVGSMNVFRAALDNDVDKILALSTDKAVAPVNLYGATKLTMERMLLAGNAHSGPKCSIVRYGNVAGSRGSVVPLWRWQKAQGLPLTVTSPDATRFWITLPEAVRFVEYSLRHMQGGETFVPQMPSVRMSDLAWTMADPMKMWTVSGMRVGEKLHETVVADHESVAGLPSPYTSDTNTQWLTGSDLSHALEAV